MPTRLVAIAVVTILTAASVAVCCAEPEVVSLKSGFDSDAAILKDVYNLMGGAAWVTKTNWMSSKSHCSWFGVTCARSSLFGEERVVSLNLYNNNLTGSIASSIGGLSELTDLCLDANNLSGSIPASLASLSKLSILFLSGNNLTGEFPQNFQGMTSLKVLVASNNNLSGGFPPFISKLTSIARLSLGNNHFNGTIPDDAFVSLKALDSIVLSGNNFQGPVPSR